MLFRTKLVYSALFSTAVLLASFAFPLIPCRTAPVVPNPIYSWSLCSLNPENASVFGSIKQYYGYTSDLTLAYFLTLIVFFVIAMIFFHLVSGRKDKRR